MILLFIESNTTGTGMMALQKARDMGYTPVLLTNDPSRYLDLKQTGAQVIVCDTNKFEKICNCISNHFASFNIAGITTTSEFYLVSVAKLAKIYNLPGNSQEAINNCRNKAKTRLCLQQAGINQPRFAVVQSPEEIGQFLPAIKLPCVVKPVDDSGSNHVRLCHTIEEVEKQVEKILLITHNPRGQENTHMVLLEEYIEALEYSVEMITFLDQTICIGITEKNLIGYPYFVEHRHIFPAVLPPNVSENIKSTVESALKAVGITFGATHTEVKYTNLGCVIIEINARLAGGMIPRLIQHVTGIDMIETQIKMAVGRLNPLNISCNGYAGIQFIVAASEGAIKSISGTDEARAIHGIDSVKITVQSENEIRPPRNSYDRLGYVIAKANTQEETRTCLQQAAEKIKLHILPK